MVSYIYFIMFLEMCLLYTRGILPNFCHEVLDSEGKVLSLCVLDERGKAWRGAGLQF